jgi:cobyric acid synthase CobQ
VAEYRTLLEAELAAFPMLHTFPSQANYLLVRRLDGGRARELAERLLAEHRIAIRVCEDYVGLDGSYFRIAVPSPEDIERFVDALGEVLPRPTPRRRSVVRKRTPALMVQGTTSNAGKSVIAAAFCRILAQDGIRVAPFKAQNMSLNSFVTHEGGEMGRAQVVQAQACRLDPEVRMNPVLLKPNSDTGSQVICLGKPLGNMDVLTYTERKAKLRGVVQDTYDAISSEYEAMVLEGAGSPAEVNLKRHDIVNMRMAQHAAAPVILVGDIDRGGVYAAFVGTLAVMEEWERRLVAGFLVNRFRGKAELLQEAHDYVSGFTGKPVLGVVPDLGLPEEDSVEFKNGSGDAAATRADAVEIVGIDLPHISNFTDFDALRLEPDVALRIVRRADELGQPDAVILPGSKNVPGDLAALRENGIADGLARLIGGGRTVIAGLCGGFQMLGTGIADPHGIESGRVSYTPGLGALSVETELARTKTLTRSRGRHVASGAEVVGYEIHHGVTRTGDCTSMFVDDEGGQLGVRSIDGRIWGTYLHGVFDADEFRRVFVDDLRARKGLEPLRKVQARYGIEAALDALAEVVRGAVDMRDIYRIMGL